MQIIANPGIKKTMKIAPDKSFKIAIASGKGGTGKTLVATNLFYVLKKNIDNVALVDCDAEAPNVMGFYNNYKFNSDYDITLKAPVIMKEKCNFCGKCKEYCSFNAIFLIHETIQVVYDLCHGCGACFFACKYGAIKEKHLKLGKVSHYSNGKESSIIESRLKIGVLSSVPVIKASINESDKNQICILDSPPGTSCPFIQTIEKADYVVLVAEPTPFGLSDLKQSVETLKTMNKKYGVIINREGIGNFDIYDYLKFENITILMQIPFSKKIASCYSKGDILVDFMPELQNDFLSMFNTIIN